MMFPRLVSVGEALTDLLHEQKDVWISQVGGAGFNVARASAQLGVRSAFAGAISTDVFGQSVWEAARVAGLDERFIQRRSKAPLLAVVHQKQPVEYFFIGDDSADLHFDPSELPSGWQEHVQCIHFGGISLARPPLSKRILSLARRLRTARDIQISYDPNFRRLMGPEYDGIMAEMAALADVIKVSDEDLKGLFRTADLEEGLAALRRLSPEATILLTLGEQGARYYHGGRAWVAQAPPIQLVDAVGAGDASMAALLYSRMTHGRDQGAQHLRMAVAAGAAACTRAGAAPPDLSHVLQLAKAVEPTEL